MNRKISVLITVMALFFSLSSHAQTYNSVDLNESIYRILDITEMKGIITNLPQIRPYSNNQIRYYLSEINAQRDLLSEWEKSVLDSALYKFNSPERERTAQNILKEGKVYFNNEEKDIFPIDSGLFFDFETRGDLNSGLVHSTNFFTFFLEGDISTYASHNINLSLGVNNVNTKAFSPYAYTNIATDGYYIAVSEGLDGSGLVDGDGDGTSFSIMTNPEFSLSFFDDQLQLNLSKVRRDMGNGYGNLTLSSTARPYTGFDIKFYPLDWFHIYYSTGSLSNWFEARESNSGGDTTIDQKMFTTQMFEFMPFKWFYLSAATSVIWGKRFELVYLNPFVLPIVGQSLAGDQDNAAAEISIAFKMPIGLKLYGSVFFDEMRSTDGLWTDPVMPFALQGGVKWVIPKIPFTVLSFQYTKLEPYVYAHDSQIYYFADDGDVFVVNWTNDNENLGYHLEPNSDEFLIRLETFLYRNLTLSLQYQYIRHGESGGDIDGGSYDKSTPWNKDFLNDGLYEKIHIATVEGAYEFNDIPVWFSLDYSFNYGQNFGLIEGNTVKKNILGMKIHIFP